MNSNKIILEGKQKNKPVSFSPVLTPEIIPETLCPLLKSLVYNILLPDILQDCKGKREKKRGFGEEFQPW